MARTPEQIKAKREAEAAVRNTQQQELRVFGPRLPQGGNFADRFDVPENNVPDPTKKDRCR